jgi:hypothetical protein
MDSVSATANKELAFMVEKELKEIPYLNPTNTGLTADQIRLDETNLTFTFVMNISRNVKESDKIKAAAAPADPNATPADPNAPPADPNAAPADPAALPTRGGRPAPQ